MSERRTAANKFWSWFGENEDELRELLEGDERWHPELGRTVSRELEKITPLNWEIGPGRGAGALHFALCPMTQEELEESRRIVALAAPLAGWEFLAARPPKAKLPGLSLDFQGKLYTFKLAEWSYELTSFDDGRFFDVTVFASPTNAPVGAFEKASTLAVQLLLGDRAFIELVDRVEIGTPPADHPTPIEYLREHIAQLAHPDVAMSLTA